MEDLRNFIVPPVEEFKLVMAENQKEMRTNKNVIIRFDEILTQKASKLSFDRLQYELKDYATNDFLSKFIAR